MSVLSDRIQQEREWVGYTPDMVAQKLGITLDEYAAFETGETEPTDNQLTNLARLVGTTPDRLRGEDLRADRRVEELVAARNLPVEDVYTLHRFAEFLRYGPRPPRPDRAAKEGS